MVQPRAASFKNSLGLLEAISLNIEKEFVRLLRAESGQSRAVPSDLGQSRVQAALKDRDKKSQDLTQQLARVKEELQQKGEENVVLLAQVRRMSLAEKEKAYLEKHIEQLHSIIAGKQQALNSLQQERHAANSAFREQVKKLQQTIHEQEVALFRLKLDIDKEKQMQKILTQELSRNSQKAAARVEGASTQQLQKLRKEVSRLDGQLSAMKEEKPKLAKEIEELKKKNHILSQANSNLVTQSRQKRQPNRQLDELKDKCKALEGKVAQQEQKIVSLEQEKEGYKSEIKDMERKMRKKKTEDLRNQVREEPARHEPAKVQPVKVQPARVQPPKEKGNLKLKILSENLQNMVRNLDQQRKKNYELTKEVDSMRRLFKSESTEGAISSSLKQWLISFYRFYMQIITELEIPGDEDFKALVNLLEEQLSADKTEDCNPAIEETNTEALSKVRLLKKASESARQNNSQVVERLKSENNVLTLLLSNRKSLGEITELIGRLEREGKFLNRAEFEAVAMSEFKKEEALVQMDDNVLLAQSFVKTVFIFLEEIIKVFEGNYPCTKMLSDAQQILRGGIMEVQKQQMMTELLERIKEWILMKIKFFRKKLSKVVLNPGKPNVLLPIQEESESQIHDQDNNPSASQLKLQIKELERSLRLSEVKIIKLSEAQRATKQEVVASLLRYCEGQTQEEAVLVTVGREDSALRLFQLLKGLREQRA